MPVIKCISCGQSFQAKTSRARFCAGRCFRANEAAAGRARLAKFTPERRRANSLVGTAIANGTLTQQPCETCGSRRNVEAHHDDYARPLDVRWLCKSHHRQHHVKHGSAPNAFVYAVAA